MNAFLKLWLWEMRIALRRKSTQLLLSLFFLTSLVAVVTSDTIVKQRHAEIQMLDHQYSAQMERLSKRYQNSEEAGYWAYYTAFPVSFKHPELASLSQGVTGNIPSVTWIRLLGIEQQLYETRLQNPLIQTLGNFDLSIVFLVLAPLIILLLGNDVLSKDRDAGRLSMLSAQTGNLHRLLWIRISVKGILVFLTMCCIFIAAMIYLKTGIQQSFLKWYAIACLGLLPWLAITAVIASRFRSVVSSLGAAIAIWLISVLILPCLINLYVSSKTDVPEGIALTIRQRQVMHNGWDEDKNTNYKQFLKERPEWQSLATVPNDFSWRWYYAMHEVADRSVKIQADRYSQSLIKRYEQSRKISCFFPTCYAQILLSNHAQTDLHSYLHQLSETRRFHETLKEYFFPIIFHDKKLYHEDTKFFPKYGSSLHTQTKPLSILPLIVAFLIPFLFYPFFKKSL